MRGGIPGSNARNLLGVPGTFIRDSIPTLSHIDSLCMWLRGTDSNRRHPGYEPGALPTELPRETGAKAGIRTRLSCLEGRCPTHGPHSPIGVSTCMQV